MRSKLGWHFQLGVPGWAPNTVNSEYVLVMDPPTENPFPGRLVLGRTYEPDEESIQRIWKGAEGAREWFDKWQPVYESRPYAHAWLGPNEPHPLADYAFRKALDKFTTILSEIMRYRGYGFVGHNWSVGWADVGHARDFSASVKTLHDNDHYLGLHEYAAPTMNEVGKDGQYWWTLRYRNTVKELLAAGVPIPNILITECGVDGGVWTPRNDPARPKVGYQGYMSPDEYIANLAWYDGELSRDDYVKGAVVFTSTPNPVDWGTFDVEEELSRKLAHHIDTFVPPTPEPEPKPDVVVVDMVNSLPRHKTKTYGRRTLKQIDVIVIHHTATPAVRGPKFVHRVAKYHVNTRGYPGIAYHYMIGPGGVIYRTNNLTTVSSHTYMNNTRGIGVCLTGNFMKQKPTDEQLRSLKWLVDHIRDILHTDIVVEPHYNMPHNKTACPGKTYLDWLGG